MKLSKNSFYKSWAPKLISSNEIFFRNIQIIFDVEKWLWKWEVCNLAGLITSTKNVQKNFQCHFCNQWSISFSLKSFYQIPLTWSKYYKSRILSENPFWRRCMILKLILEKDFQPIVSHKTCFGTKSFLFCNEV